MNSSENLENKIVKVKITGKINKLYKFLLDSIIHVRYNKMKFWRILLLEAVL